MPSLHKFADLHLHTKHSDGQYSVKAVIDRCVKEGLTAISIVDHDDVSALAVAAPYGAERGVEVITGVELSVTWHDYDLHLLGYCFDPKNPDLTNYLNLFKGERIKRAKKIVEKLEELGMPISFEHVEKNAGNGTIGRPHIAQVLVSEGFAYSFQDAFDRFIGDGKPANANKYKMDLESALKLIKTAGGLCVIAHPGLQLMDDDVLRLIEAQVDGLEVIHPAHDTQRSEFYRELVKKHSLLETGGSDFHGGRKGETTLGKYKIPYEWVVGLKEAASTRSRQLPIGL